MFRWKKRRSKARRRCRALLRVSPSFVLLLLLFAGMDSAHLLLQILLAAGLHECAHLGVLCFFGGEIAAFRLTAFGGELSIRNARRLSYGQEMAAVLAGPVSNLLCAAVLSRLAWMLSWERGYVIAGIHMLLALFNLLPLGALDGGRALYLCLCWLWEPITAMRVVHAVSLAVLCPLLFFAAAMQGRIGLQLPLFLAEIWFIRCWFAETGIVKRAGTG